MITKKYSCTVQDFETARSELEKAEDIFVRSEDGTQMLAVEIVVTEITLTSAKRNVHRILEND